MTKETEITLYGGNLPAQVSRRVETEFNRQVERIVATGEIGMTGMSALSEVERHAAYKVAITAAAAELLARGAAATRPQSEAEVEAQSRLFGEYTQRMAQLAEMTNIKILQAVNRAAEELGKRTFADAVEDFDARLADAVAGRPNRPALPNGNGRR